MKLRVGERAPAVVLDALDGSRLDCTSPNVPVALVFTRYTGCPTCQLHVSSIAAAMPEFRARSCAVWVVFQSTPARLSAAMAEWKPGFSAVADPAARLYDAFGVATSVAGFVHLRSLLALGRALAAGKRHGRLEGREMQMPAEFVLDHRGRIALAHYGRTLGDHAPTPALLAAVDSVTPRQGDSATSR